MPAGADPLVSPVADKPRMKTDNLAGFIAVHLLAALAFVPWFFSWTGVGVFFTGVYVFGVLGINLGFHRLLTHRSFSCPRWLEHALALFGTCSLQFSPAHWVAVHRRHHHHSDEEMDPHSPLKSFVWAHVGWLLVKLPDMRAAVLTERYARDMMRDPVYAWLERRKNWMKLGFGAGWRFSSLVFLQALPLAHLRATPCNLVRACSSGAALREPYSSGTPHGR